MGKILLAFDTDQIKRYVFATGKLKEIRGASRILVDLNDMMKTAIESIGEVIYANAGSGLFVVEADVVSDTITKFNNIYSARTAGAASITGAFIELPPNFDKNTTPIQPHWKLLSRKLELAKMQKTAPQAILTFPLLRHCDSCGEYSASEEREDGVICPVCHAKRERRKDTPSAESFEDISNHSKPKGYFALLYADGDGFGTEIEKNCRTLSEIGIFATAVDAALRESADAATKHLFKDAFDTLLQGGDDLIIALPAQHALKAAHEIVVNFRKRIKETLKMPLTISAAVVWAHDKFPFANFLHLTESTLRFAKNHGRGLINFLVVSNANHLDFKEYYKTDLAFDEQTLKVIRTRRPYTPEALCQLLEVRRDNILKDAPPTKIQQLRQAVFQPTHSKASLESILALSHWRNHEQRNYFINLPPKFLEDGETAWIFPWTKRGEELRTPFADLAEIYDFTEGGNYAAPNE